MTNFIRTFAAIKLAVALCGCVFVQNSEVVYYVNE